MAILFHPLEIETRIKTKIVHLFDWWYIMIWKLESSKSTRINRSLIIIVAAFST